MIIQKKRIRSLERYLPESLRDQEIRFGVVTIPLLAAKVHRAGFTGQPTPGQVILPSIVGPVTRFNAEGKHKPLRHLPMEKAYRQMDWTHTEYHGPDAQEVTSVVDIPYKRYPRQFTPPPGVEMNVLMDQNGRVLITTAPMQYIADTQAAILHAINVCLELFGECEVFASDFAPILPANTNRINWNIFPPGKYPWERVHQVVQPIVDKAKQGQQRMIIARLKTVSDYEPDFVATGNGGFHGYIVFGFPNIPLYVLESAYYGNATYIFDRDWQTLSQLTKAEIINGNLHKDRLVHLSGWASLLAKHFPKA